MKKGNQSEIIKALSMVTQIGISMMVPIGMCVALGVWIGNKYHIDWIVVPLFFVGALAGFSNIRKAVEPFIKNSTKKEKHVKKNQ